MLNAYLISKTFLKTVYNLLNEIILTLALRLSLSPGPQIPEKKKLLIFCDMRRGNLSKLGPNIWPKMAPTQPSFT